MPTADCEGNEINLTSFVCQTKRDSVSLFSVLILFLACILGCKSTAPGPSWTKTKVLSHDEDHPSRIIADDSFVYFVNGAGTIAAKNEGTNNIKRISLKDGSVSVLVKGGEHFPSDALAVDDKFLYWSAGGTILRVRKDGGGSEAVVSDAPGSPAEMAVDNENIYWYKTQVYFTDIANVYSLPK